MLVVREEELFATSAVVSKKLAKVFTSSAVTNIKYYASPLIGQRPFIG